MNIALIGNPNSGKTTLFNYLTGSNQKVGNYPGVTICAKIAKILHSSHQLIDLPGVYSLTPYTDEEAVAETYLREQAVDLVINIVDATSLERGLYLTSQLFSFDYPLIIVLNRIDQLPSTGLKIDIAGLSHRLQVPVFAISAAKPQTIQKLVTFLKAPQLPKHKELPFQDTELNQCLLQIAAKINDSHSLWCAERLWQGDSRFEKYNTPTIQHIIGDTKGHEERLIEARYQVIDQICHSMLFHQTKRNITEKLDQFFLNRYLGLPLFIIIIGLIYYITIGSLGLSLQQWFQKGFETIASGCGVGLQHLGISKPIYSLLMNGILAGVGTILTFLPQLFLLSFCLYLLEASGYLSRIAFLMDKLFHRLGMSGKTVIPFLIGTSCSVPGIMATKIIEDSQEKQSAIVLTPMIPCSAKLPTIVLFVSMFFKGHTILVFLSLYLLAACIIVMGASLLNKRSKKQEETVTFELPRYQVPNIWHAFMDGLDKVGAFIGRAGTTILLSSCIIWFLLSFSFSLEYGIPIENSIMGWIGSKLAWMFYPIFNTYSWEATVCALQGFIAKEQVMSAMAVLSGISEGNIGNEIFSSRAFAFFTPTTAYAFMVFHLFSAPCIGSVIAMAKELKSRRKALITLFSQIVFAWILATLIAQIFS